MQKPLVILVGADKGGVGKTTVSRALDCYLAERQAIGKVFDGEWPRGDLRQFAQKAEVVDLQALPDQMKVFDRLAGVTLVDIKAGQLAEVMDALIRTGLLDDVRAGRFSLALLHVLGPSSASLQEIATITQKLGAGALHLLVKNYVNESGFKEWESDPRFAEALSTMSRMVIPHLEATACTAVQQQGQSFSDFIRESTSGVLRGYVRSWLREAYAAFDASGLG